ncbi:MAG: hypothetical protein ACRC31_00450 [Cetobacterium sp.]
MSIKKISNIEKNLSNMSSEDKAHTIENALVWTERTAGDKNAKLMLQSLLLYSMFKAGKNND